MKTPLPTHITTIGEAKDFLGKLFNNGESYHPEDDARDCLEHVTDEEATHINRLMDEIYALPGNSDMQNMAFDPCEFYFTLIHNERAEIVEAGIPIIQDSTCVTIGEQLRIRYNVARHLLKALAGDFSEGLDEFIGMDEKFLRELHTDNEAAINKLRSLKTIA